MKLPDRKANAAGAGNPSGEATGVDSRQNLTERVADTAESIRASNLQCARPRCGCRRRASQCPARDIVPAWYGRGIES